MALTDSPNATPDTAPAPVTPGVEAPEVSAAGAGPTAGPQVPGAVPPNAAPAPLPKETFRQGMGRGARGKVYAVDAQGNMTEVRTTNPTKMSTFGSILAGAAMGALHGASAARPGGIPSHELGGGFGAGAKAAEDFMERRDALRRQQANQQFERNKEARQMTGEEQERAVRIAQMTAQTVKFQQETAFEAQNHPWELMAKEAQATEAIQKVNEYWNKQSMDYLNLVKVLSENGADAQVFIDTNKDPWGKALPYAKDIGAQRMIPMPTGGTYKAGEDNEHGVGLYRMNDLNKPLLKNEVYNTYSLDKKGNLVTTPQTMRGDGTHTLFEYASAVYRGTAQLELLTSQQKTSADIAKARSETYEAGARGQLAQAQTALVKSQVDAFNKLGVTIPDNYKAPAEPVKMSKEQLLDNMKSQGVSVPPNFESLYAVGHYNADLSKTFSSRPYNRPGAPLQMSQAQALDYIRAFINPSYDEKNYQAVLGMQKEFASTKPNTAGGNLIAFNTATGHLGALYDAADALQNGDIGRLNAIANRYGVETGKSAVPVFNAIKTALVGELGKTFKQAAPDIPERNDITETINANQSPGQLKDVARQYAHLMLTKAGAQVAHYYAYTGELPKEAVQPDAQGVYDRMGIDWRSATNPGAPRAAQLQNQPTQQPPAGATGVAKGSDNNWYWHDAQGNAISLAPAPKFPPQR